MSTFLWLLLHSGWEKRKAGSGDGSGEEFTGKYYFCFWPKALCRFDFCKSKLSKFSWLQEKSCWARQTHHWSLVYPTHGYRLKGGAGEAAVQLRTSVLAEPTRGADHYTSLPLAISFSLQNIPVCVARFHVVMCISLGFGSDRDRTSSRWAPCLGTSRL